MPPFYMEAIMKILVINAGSSSLKYQLMDMENEEIIAKGLVERIGIEGANLVHRPTGKDSVRIEQPMKDHTDAIKHVLKALTNPEYGVITDMSAINAVGHRVLHGGDKFTKSMLINENVMDAIRAAIPLGPLHNPANIMGIEACQKVMPATPMVAVFDTAFHQTMPDYAYIYGIPYEYYKKLHIRRYGFHGTSHRYLAQRTAEFMGRPSQGLRIVTCHLGNGSSLCAIKDGKCIDTSMGLTPLEGVLMGTRSGDIDPTVVQYLMNNENMTIDQVISLLNKKSGLIGITGVSSDMRDVLEAAEAGNDMARLAVDVFCYRITKYIGAYAAAMGGLDAVVFSAGIGENNPKLRKMIVSNLGFLGVGVDDGLNAKKVAEIDISSRDAKVRTLVIATNEELMIARDTLALVK
jgi:acetate kinase